MTQGRTAFSLRLCLLVLLLAGQAVALAHSVEEAIDPSHGVCHLCIASHAMGAAAVDNQSGELALPSHHALLVPTLALPRDGAPLFAPSQRGPPR